jgi:glycine dehydrogenase
MNVNNFSERHNGPRSSEVNQMLKSIGMSSMEELISKTIPAGIRLKKDVNVADGLSESEYLQHIKALGAKNKLYKTYIGRGYFGTITPSVILRNVLENPGWYTAYTPYQAEIAQGRLEALLNFQTMVMDLTGMEIANASLLDEGTAAGEAMIMFYNARSREQAKNNVNKFFISEKCYAQTIDVVIGRATPLGIEVVVGDHNTIEFGNEFFGALIQYPDADGNVKDYSMFTQKAHDHGVRIAVAADIMALVLLKSPGSWGADAVVGNTQRFGVPMGYGGPHAAFFATKDEFKRSIPGRIIGVSIDKDGNRALRMALQTREQHIKRDKATSNICTAQALLAVMASMYAVYHGSEGVQQIAKTIHKKTYHIAKELKQAGINVINHSYFDTLTIHADEAVVNKVREIALKNEINLRYDNATSFGLSIDETTTNDDVNNLLKVIGEAFGKSLKNYVPIEVTVDINLFRTDAVLAHDIFNRYHSETEMMRYLKRLENKDLSLVHSMISLGSCTMKLNAASELMPITWPEFATLHPFVPIDQAQGYGELLEQLDKDLSEITGFAKMSLQPNSGAQGEYAGLMVIRAYHESRGEGHRNICLIPSSAHGTNPASAVMAGMTVVVTKCDDNGNIDVSDIRAKAEQYKDSLSCLMVTYPSTHGVFEESIIDITSIIHQYGGQVYMDGANMNAQVGLTNPGNIGADVCHLNLHKTFAIPHGGGGPGMGPIGVAKHLVPFLPNNPFVNVSGKEGIKAISAAPYGSALILLISYGYIKMLGAKGIKEATELAILNANYLKAKLEKHYPILYMGKNNTVAHEMILDCRDFKRTAGVEVEDIAKRLMDYGFHAPTVSFPVAGTLMIEPTESEALQELDRFAEAMINIRKEITAIENGDLPQDENMLKNAPHTAALITANEWTKPYSRQVAAYPLGYLQDYKYWPSVRRVDNAYGDRNLVCSCLPIEHYESAIN